MLLLPSCRGAYEPVEKGGTPAPHQHTRCRQQANRLTGSRPTGELSEPANSPSRRTLMGRGFLLQADRRPGRPLNWPSRVVGPCLVQEGLQARLVVGGLLARESHVEHRDLAMMPTHPFEQRRPQTARWYSCLVRLAKLTSTQTQQPATCFQSKRFLWISRTYGTILLLGELKGYKETNRRL